jgi:hypothetical protein
MLSRLQNLLMLIVLLMLTVLFLWKYMLHKWYGFIKDEMKHFHHHKVFLFWCLILKLMQHDIWLPNFYSFFVSYLHEIYLLLKSNLIMFILWYIYFDVDYNFFVLLHFTYILLLACLIFTVIILLCHTLIKVFSIAEFYSNLTEEEIEEL